MLDPGSIGDLHPLGGLLCVGSGIATRPRKRIELKPDGNPACRPASGVWRRILDGLAVEPMDDPAVIADFLGAHAKVEQELRAARVRIGLARGNSC